MRMYTVCALLLMMIGTVVADDAQVAKDKLFIAALSRLSIDVKSNAAIKAKLDGVLDRNKGTEQFVELVDKFDLDDRVDDLLDLATAKPGETLGVEAVKLVLKFKGNDQLNKLICGKDEKKADATLKVLGFAQLPAANDMIAAVALDTKQTKPRRTAAIRALGNNRGGEQLLLSLVKQKKLSEDMHFVVGSVLFASLDGEIRKAAEKALPRPTVAGGKALAPVAELVKIKGDAAKGKVVYQTFCFICHQVDGVGIDFGPALSEIGSKLPKSELFISILDPGAGVSFNYEGYRVKLKSGQEVIGLQVSNADDELALKMPGGIVNKYKKSDIVSQQVMKESLMTPGLEKAMTQQQLVDLVEYLASLKKK